MFGPRITLANDCSPAQEMGHNVIHYLFSISLSCSACHLFPIYFKNASNTGRSVWSQAKAARGTEVIPSSPATTCSRVHSRCAIRKFRAKYQSSKENESKKYACIATMRRPGSIHSILYLSACPTFSCPGIYIIEYKNVKSPVSKYLRWCFGASQAAGSSSEDPRSNGGRGRCDQDPVRTARGAQVSERHSPRSRGSIRPVCHLPHPLDPG